MTRQTASRAATKYKLRNLGIWTFEHWRVKTCCSGWIAYSCTTSSWRETTSRDVLNRGEARAVSWNPVELLRILVLMYQWVVVEQCLIDYHLSQAVLNPWFSSEFIIFTHDNHHDHQIEPFVYCPSCFWIHNASPWVWCLSRQWCQSMCSGSSQSGL